MDIKGKTQEAIIPVLLEQDLSESVACIQRGDDVVFIFSVREGQRTVMLADVLLGALIELRKNPLPELQIEFKEVGSAAGN